MKNLLLLALIGLGGCAFSSQTYGPSGKLAHSIGCNGGANSWATCYEKAGSICGTAGYDVVSQNGTVTPFGVASGYANAAGGSFTGVGGGLVSRSLLVQCKAPA